MRNVSTNLIRYPGGKQRLLPYFIDALPNRETIKGKYIEPFVGGASVYFHLQPKKALLADINEELIGLYRGIKSDPVGVWQKYSRFPDNKSGYYDIRDMNTEGLDYIEKAARTLYLNRTCFKGMWRHNKQGKFNVGYGGEDRRWVISEETLREASTCLTKTALKTKDFEEVIDRATDRDFIFLDPPYAPGKIEMMNDHYRYSQFGLDEQIRLARALKRAAKRGVKWLMTNSDHGEITKLYSTYTIKRLKRGTGDKPGLPAKVSKEVVIYTH